MLRYPWFGSGNRAQCVVAKSAILVGVLFFSSDAPCQLVRLDAARVIHESGTASAPVCGDFNRDGHIDIAYGGRGREEFDVLFGDGRGGFATATFPAAYNPGAALAADFNGDGHLDLAFGHSANSDHDVSVHLGDGVGGFASGANVVGPAKTVFLNCGDFNEDGALDLAAVDETSGRVWIHLGDGAGLFEVGVPIAVGGSPQAIAIADFNADTHLDLAVTVYRNSRVILLIGDGTGGFVAADPLVILGARHVAADDLDRDGNVDLAITTYEHSELRILYGNGDATFIEPNPPIEFESGAFADWVISEDFDTDGHLDLVIGVGLSSYDAIHVLRGDGSRGFSPTQRLPLPGWPSAIRAADFDENGILDLALLRRIDDAIAVVLDSGVATFADYVRTPVGQTYSLATADFNGDGRPDAAVAEFETDSVAIRLNDGSGGWTEAASLPVGDGPVFVASDDFNEDGLADLLVCNHYDSNLTAALGNGDGTFAIVGAFATLFRPTEVAIADVDSDAHLDLLVASADEARIGIHLGDGNGAFDVLGAQILEEPPFGITTADFNADGHVDFAVVQFVRGRAAAYLGDGTGSFQRAGIVPVGTPLRIGTADLDLDGHVDLVATSGIYELVKIGYGDGTGQFPGQQQYSADEAVERMAFGDIDENGFPDIVLGNFGASSITILPSLGVRSFGDAEHYLSGSFPSDVAVVDFDSDGHVDIVACCNNGTPDTLDVYTNLVARQKPEFLPPTPCGLDERVAAFVPLRAQIVAQSRTDAAGDEVTIDTVGTGLPPGAVIDPELPTPPGQPAIASIDWTPRTADLGPHTATFVATGSDGKRASCDLRLEVAPQMHLLFAERKGSERFDAGLGGHVFPTSLASIWRDVTVLPGSTPQIAEAHARFVPASEHLVDLPLRRALNRSAPLVFSVQAVSFDPDHDPIDPERSSNVIEIRRNPDGSITTRELGVADGMQLSVEIIVDAMGGRSFHFPITIDP